MGLFSSSSNQAVLTNPSKAHFPSSFNIYHPKLSSKAVLGPSDKQPVYVADFPKGGLSAITLYDGPSANGGALAICRPHAMGRTCDLYVPPMGTGNQPIHEELRTEKQFFKEVYSFTVVVGHGPNARPEKFQWKTGGMKSYKLVRLADRGEETVAEWSYDAFGGLRSKLASFNFLGSGATGELGDAWAIMAVITMLRTVQVHVQATAGLSVAGVGNVS